MGNIIAEKIQFGRVRQWFLSFFHDEFFLQKYNRYILGCSVLTNIIMWIMILINIQAQDKPIPLHANAFYGVELVGSGFLFLNLPLIGLILLIANIFLGRFILRFDKFLAQTIIAGGLIIQIFLFIASLNIVLLGRL